MWNSLPKCCSRISVALPIHWIFRQYVVGYLPRKAVGAVSLNMAGGVCNCLQGSASSFNKNCKI